MSIATLDVPNDFSFLVLLVSNPSIFEDASPLLVTKR